MITQYGGTTVEVLNTDAEGRLVLADALAYADAQLDPDVVIDLATLTGAISSGLGKRHAGLFANDDRLAAALLAAGEASGEGIWRMPLVEDYRDSIDSSVADLKNVSTPGAKNYNGGAIVAALFLREFVAIGVGRISTSPALAEPTLTSTRSPRVPLATASGCCCTGSRALIPCGVCASRRKQPAEAANGSSQR